MHPVKVLLVLSHPIQYHAPLFRLYAADPRLEVTVAYCSLQGAEPGFDPEFGVEVAWDIPLLDGYRWVHPRNRSPWPGLSGSLGLVNPGLWRIIRRGEFDVVVCSGHWAPSFWIAALAAKVGNAAVAFATDAHTLVPRDGARWKIPFKRLIFPRLYRIADSVMVSSTGGRQLLRGLGIPEGRIVLLPNVVDNEWWTARAAQVNRSAARRAWGIREDASVVLFCGKLQPWKRPRDLLDAFAMAKVPNSCLVLAGEGPLRCELELAAKRLGILEQLRFLGFVNQSYLPELYASCDIMVLPSAHEPCSYAVLESMLCGCPPVVSDDVWLGRKDVLSDGETGFVFRCGDVQMLANILKDALGDSERLSQMARAARTRMATWSPKENVEALVRAATSMAALKDNARHVSQP